MEIKIGDYVKHTDDYLSMYRPFLRDTRSKTFIIIEEYPDPDHDGLYLGKCSKGLPYFFRKESIRVLYQLEFDL